MTADGAGHPAHQLRVRLADRSLGATNPLLGVAAALVELAGGRLTATQVLDLAGADPVRARFGWGDDDLERVSHWVAESGIRWGYDAAHRRTFGVPVDANTWRFGMRRVLLGAAMSGQGHRFVGGTLPIDDVGDGDLELAGRFAELVERLHSFTGRAERAQTVEEWTSAIADAVHALTSTALADAWQLAQFDREIGRITSSVSGATTTLRHADVRALLQHRLRGRPTRSNFRTGTLTVCTMVPMRSVPHRVVCLVGLDDGVFPRIASIDGDDVLARRPLTGERDLRSEDRQLLLDAIGAATETLVVTYTGRGEQTGAARPPAVPLGRAARRPRPHGRRARCATRCSCTTRSSPSTRSTSCPGASAAPSRSPSTAPRSPGHWRRGAPGSRCASWCGSRCRRPTPSGDVALADLHDFFKHPVRGFFRGRLRVTTPYDVDEAKDSVPIVLDGLEQWAVGDRLVGDVLAGADPQTGMVAEQLRGLLPPGELGVGVLTSIVQKVRPLVTHGLSLRTGPARSLDVDIDLGDRRVTGTVGNVWGNNLVRGQLLQPRRQAPPRRVDRRARAGGGPPRRELDGPHDRQAPHRRAGRDDPAAAPSTRPATGCGELIDVYDRGQCEPLPLPVKTSLAYAEDYRFAMTGRDADPDVKAEREWTTPRFNETGFPREDQDPWHVRAFGEHPPYSLLTAPLRADEPDPAPHRLAHYAWLTWGPLLSDGHELVRSL